MSSLLDSVKTLEGLLTCQICNKPLVKTHTVGECGHNFCYQCVSEKLGKDATCPTCHLPAVIKNLQKTLMYDNLLALTLKLKQVASRDSQVPSSFKNNPNITFKSFASLDAVLENEQQQQGAEEEEKENDADDTADKELDTFDLSSLSQISEEEDTTSGNHNRKEESGKKTSSSDGEDSKHAKRRKLSAAMGQSCDENGLESNNFSNMDNDVKKQHNDDNQQTSDSDTWHCKWCFFEHEAYISTCSICHKYRGSEYVPRLLQNDLPSTAAQSSQSSQKKSTNQKGSLKRKLEPELEEVHILTTGLTDKEEASLKRNLTAAAKSGMRIIVHHDLKKFDQVTHIITSMDKEGLCKRTLKYLSSIICGKWVLDQSWLTHSVKREQWLREQPYEVKGDQAAGKTNAPSTGRKLHEEKRPLFGDKFFFFSGDFPSKYNKKDLAQLCQSAGGTLLKRKPTLADKNLQNTYIIHPDSSKSTQHWLDDFQVKDPSWIIDSVSKLSIA